MERIKVGEYEFAAKSTAASLFYQKFQPDGLKDLIALTQGMPNDAGGYRYCSVEGHFDFDTFYRFLWVFAKLQIRRFRLAKWLEVRRASVQFAIEVLPQSMDLLLIQPKQQYTQNHPAAAVKKQQRYCWNRQLTVG